MKDKEGLENSSRIKETKDTWEVNRACDQNDKDTIGKNLNKTLIVILLYQLLVF
jgi:hypothetical protein